MSNCMLCAVLHCLSLSHPHRTHLLQLLFSQSTRLPPAHPLTRWRGHLQQVVVVPTQDLPLNLWPTHLNLTIHAHRAVPVCSSHRMGRWINKYTVLPLEPQCVWCGFNGIFGIWLFCTKGKRMHSHHHCKILPRLCQDVEEKINIGNKFHYLSTNLTYVDLSLNLCCCWTVEQ